ncbi:hypothetical protein APHAL10511_004677 [Amanita phalloides]|nr:hypothetical protein APHAL10511_004677 [Amanita phalloides]
MILEMIVTAMCTRRSSRDINWTHDPVDRVPMPSFNSLKQFKHHPEYHFSDGNLHILVKDTHFCVHSYFFTRESPTFQGYLNVLVAPGEAPKGTGSNAVVLEDITAEQFSIFLWVFYDCKYSRITNEENWTIILDLAHRWGFCNVKALALDKLEGIDMPLVKRIALYREYDVPEGILAPHYTRLCARPQILTLDETEILGGATTIMIFAIRERLLSGQNGVRTLEQIEDKLVHRCVNSYIESRKKQSNQGKDDANKNKTVNGNGSLQK